MYTLGAVGFYLHLQDEYQRDLRASADRQMDIAQAVRQFTTVHVKELLLRDEQQFHQASVPTFAANTTMQYLQTLYPGQQYREVALNPMNPKNMVQDWELEAVNEFRSTGKLEFTSPSKDASAMNFARPIVVANAACLTCHGSPGDAPSTVRAKYGVENGFGWRLGEVIGAQVVSIPTSLPRKRRNQHLAYYLGASLLALGGGFVGLRLGLHRGVLAPIENAGNVWRKLASEDPLTGTASRRSILDVLDLLTGPGANGCAVSVIFIDIDHFKLVNDTYGHLAGDQILRDFAQRIMPVARQADVIGRYGGEELLVVLPVCKRKDAATRAHALRQVIVASPFTVIGLDGLSYEVAVTASFGVAEWLPGESMDQLLVRADAALYRAKSGGRNQVRVARQYEDAGGRWAMDTS